MKNKNVIIIRFWTLKFLTLLKSWNSVFNQSSFVGLILFLTFTVHQKYSFRFPLKNMWSSSVSWFLWRYFLSSLKHLNIAEFIKYYFTRF